MADSEWVRDVVLDSREKIQAFPPGAHWWCPANGGEEGSIFNDPEEPDDQLTVGEKHSRIKESRLRKEIVYTNALILGTVEDFPEAPEWKESFETDLHKSLTTCFECVREYHSFRRPYLAILASAQGDELADGFSGLLNASDFQRIDNGLRKAKAILENTLSVDRKPKVLNDYAETTCALSEALCCEPYHTDDENLSRIFDDVFALVQTNKTLRLGEILPASTHFLFSDHEIRRSFAIASWGLYPTQSVPLQTFEWAVRGGLQGNLITLNRKFNRTVRDIEVFWAGVLTIVNKLDRASTKECFNLETEGQPSICNLLMMHFGLKSPTLLALLTKAFRLLIERAPKHFFNAFGGAAPWSVVEVIFKSPSFPSLFDQSEDVGEDGLRAWIVPYINALEPNHRQTACDTLLHNLFERLQGDPTLDQGARRGCLLSGLDALAETIKTFLPEDREVKKLTTRIVVHNVLALVVKYKGTIFSCAVLQDRDEEGLVRLAMGVVKNALKLDCKVISAEYDLIHDHHSNREEEMYRQSRVNEKNQIDLKTNSIPIWQAVLDAFTTNSLGMAQHILVGLTQLIGIEEFKVVRRGGSLPPDMSDFNKSFADLSDVIARIFERLIDFSTSDLKRLFEDKATARSMYGALLSANEDISRAMLMLLVRYTGESARKDAISKLLHETRHMSVQSVTWAIRAISKQASFAPTPGLLRVSREVLDGLCDTHGGVLREIQITPKEEYSLEEFWDCQWSLMTMAFQNTEKWSAQPDTNKAQMADFARDVMEHADLLFDQYALLKSSLTGSSKGAKGLSTPMIKAMDGMVYWLRLRDAYLVSTLVGLVSKLLRRLGEENVTLNRFALDYIIDCAQVQEQQIVRTNLTPQQKAELRRAVDQHQGFEVIAVGNSHRSQESKKQSRLDAWSKSDGVKHAEKSRTSQIGPSLTPTSDTHRTHLDRMKKRNHGNFMSKEEKLAASRQAAMKAVTGGAAFKEKRAKEAREKAAVRADAVAKANEIRGIRVGVPGQGSGLQGIGIEGKDHTPKIESIMVDSDTEEEDEDDEEDAAQVRELLGKKPSSAFSEIESARRKQQMQGPVRIAKVVRSAKDMRARLSPNMDLLHLTILNWDFFHQGDVPPDSAECQQIADKFMAAHEYKNTMYPLLVSEAWKDLVTIREEGKMNKSKPFGIKIVNRMSVDNYIEVTTTIPQSEMRDQDISEGSIILLSQGQDPLRDDSAPNCLARVFKTARKPNARDRWDISYRVSNRVKSKILSALAPGAEIRGVAITTMTTIEREFAALHSLEYFDLCDEVLNARPSPILKYSDAAIAPIERNYKVNKAQAKAILSARENDAFTLIQGPPGSGKTKTIVAMVGAILTGNLGVQGTATSRPPLPKPVGKKLLICAPSNAAVDEIVARLKLGVKTLTGQFHNINVLRIGRLSTINTHVQDVSLEKLVMARMDGNAEENKAIEEERAKRDKLHRDAGELKQIVNDLRSRMDAALTSGDKATEDELRLQLDTKRRAQARIGFMIENIKDGGNVLGRNREVKRRELQQQLIDSAHVVCATLSGSGHDMFKNMAVEFETVIIDEAAQCIELSALIPLKYGCSKCILVGDPKQLPATVLSKMAASYGYEQSLFVRMQKNHPEDTHLLDTQYRMHPEISLFPSQRFYDGKLVDGNNMAVLRTQPWHSHPLLSPYRFFDVKGNQQRGPGHSLMNTAEIAVAMQLYKRITSDYRGIDWRGKVGIITPYKAQLNQLRVSFQQVYGDSIFDQIEFNTTDAFQGREAEVIIFSCVRAQAAGGVGFLNDIRRMNVGLTRAKASLWVLGDSQSLKQGPYWNMLITDAQQRGRYTAGDVMSLLNQPSADPEAATAPFNEAGGPPSNTVQDAPASEFPIEDAMRRSSIQDTTMTDAPSPAFSGLEGSSTAPATEEGLDVVYKKRGRAFGRDCVICGSSTHTAANCDNEEMLKRKQGCFRCNEPGHHSDHCQAPRCMNCGRFGHLDRYCINQPLSFGEKRKLDSEEATFARQRATHVERRQKLMSNGHDPKIPVIQTTPQPAPPPRPEAFQNGNGKRRRDSSPSDDMTNKKALMGSGQQQRPMNGVPNGPRGNMVDGAPNGPRSMPNGRGSGPANGRPQQGLPQRRKKPADPFIKPKPRR